MLLKKTNEVSKAQGTFPSSSYWVGLIVVIVGLAILSLNNNI
jgi:hypothetical protein